MRGFFLSLGAAALAVLLLVGSADAEPWWCRLFPWLPACRPPPIHHVVPRVTNLKAKVNTGESP